VRTQTGTGLLIGVVALVALGWLVHGPLLRAVGEALVVDEPVQNADVIVIAADALEEGVMEAAALANNGIAPRVAVFTFGSRPRRGPTARAVAALNRYGVAVVEQIPTPVTGTTDSVPVLLAWCRLRGFHTVVMIATSDHSRRVRRVLDRTIGDSRDVRVGVRVARPFTLSPDEWWVHGGEIYRVMVEVPKLLVDVARHPRS
jgi:hypothetical protein